MFNLILVFKKIIWSKHFQKPKLIHEKNNHLLNYVFNTFTAQD